VVRERAAKLSAWCIKTLQNERTNSEITTGNGDNTPKINEPFVSYYSLFNSSEGYI